MSSMTKEGERMMAVVLGNLHPTSGSDKGARDVQFMHTFVLEHKAGDASSNGDSFEDSEFSIVDEVFRRVDPVGDSRAPGGLAAGAASLLRAAQSPPPTRLPKGGGSSMRDGDSPPANDSEDEMNSSLEPVRLFIFITIRAIRRLTACFVYRRMAGIRPSRFDARRTKLWTTASRSRATCG